MTQTQNGTLETLFKVLKARDLIGNSPDSFFRFQENDQNIPKIEYRNILILT